MLAANRWGHVVLHNHFAHDAVIREVLEAVQVLVFTWWCCPLELVQVKLWVRVWKKDDVVAHSALYGECTNVPLYAAITYSDGHKLLENYCTYASCPSTNFLGCVGIYNHKLPVFLVISSLLIVEAHTSRKLNTAWLF